MSVFMKMRIEVDPHHLDEFLDALKTLVVPMNEENGMIFHACFVEVLGPIKPVVVNDIWEVESAAVAATGFLEQPFANDPRWIEYSRRVKDIILNEETVMMVKQFGQMKSFLGEDDQPDRSTIFTEDES